MSKCFVDAVRDMVNYLKEAEEDDWVGWLCENGWMTESERTTWEDWGVNELLGEMSEARKLELAREHPEHIYSSVLIAWQTVKE